MTSSTPHALRRIAILHYGGAALRGTEVCVVQLIAALHEQGVEVSLIANYPDVIQSHLQTPTRWVDTCRFRPVLVEQMLFRDLFTYIRDFWRLWRKLRRRDVDMIFASGGLPCQLGLPLGRALGKPVICHFHHPATRRYFYAWLIRWADYIVAPSRHTASFIKAGCDRDSIVVPNGVDASETYAPAARDPAWRAKLGIPASAVVVGQLGALVPSKRQNVLVDAVELLRKRDCDVHAVFIGDGSERASLEQAIRTKGLNNVVHMLGRVPEVPPYLQHVLDVHVLPSSEEGFGIAIIEAAACGLPNVVSVPGAMSEVVTHEFDGLHVDGGNAESIAAALERLCKDPALRAKLGANAAVSARTRFSVRRHQDNMLEVLTRAASPSGYRERPQGPKTT